MKKGGVANYNVAYFANRKLKKKKKKKWFIGFNLVDRFTITIIIILYFIIYNQLPKHLNLMQFWKSINFKQVKETQTGSQWFIVKRVQVFFSRDSPPK